LKYIWLFKYRSGCNLITERCYQNPLCFDVEVIAFAIALAYAFGGPTAYGIYDIGGAFNRPETVSKAMAEGVDDTSLW